MNRIFRIVVPVLGSLMMCSLAYSQGRGGRAAAGPNLSRVQAPVHAPILRSSSNSPAAPSPTGAQTCCQTTVSNVELNGLDNVTIRAFANTVSPECRSGVPGLGFDYPHLAAVCGSQTFGGPFGIGGAGAPFYSYAPGFGGGDQYAPEVDTSAMQPGQQQPQNAVIQQPAPGAAARSATAVPHAFADAEGSSATSSPVAPAPVRDVGHFVFLRRDGKVLFASIFSISEGRVQYVTPEGIRRSVALAELDAEGTRRMNSALGSQVEIPR